MCSKREMQRNIGEGNRSCDVVGFVGRSCTGLFITFKSEIKWKGFDAIRISSLHFFVRFVHFSLASSFIITFSSGYLASFDSRDEISVSVRECCCPRWNIKFKWIAVFVCYVTTCVDTRCAIEWANWKDSRFFTIFLSFAFHFSHLLVSACELNATHLFLWMKWPDDS